MDDLILGYDLKIKGLIDDCSSVGKSGVFDFLRDYSRHTFVVASMSLFEKKIKDACRRIVERVREGAPVPKELKGVQDVLNKIKKKKESSPEEEDESDDDMETDRTAADEIYSRILTEGAKRGAGWFYATFGGEPFKEAVRDIFEKERVGQVKRLEEYVSEIEDVKKWEPLGGYRDKLTKSETEANDMLTLLRKLTFPASEDAFLSLKVCRNIVAHDFNDIEGALSETFNELRDLYYSAILYVCSVETRLKEIRP